MIKCVIDFKYKCDREIATAQALKYSVSPLDISTSYKPLRDRYRFVGCFENKVHANQFINQLLADGCKLDNMQIRHKNRLRED